jgi:hypothetical protein
LKAAIRAQSEKLIRPNKTRTDFGEKFDALIESYNNTSMDSTCKNVDGGCLGKFSETVLRRSLSSSIVR